MGFERDKRATRGRGPRGPAGKETISRKANERMRSSSLGGFDEARGALGFSEKRAAALELSEDGGALRPWMPVPGLLRDLVDEPSALGVGGSFDLLESERERRRRLRATRLMDTLQTETPSVRSVGEAFGDAAQSTRDATTESKAESETSPELSKAHPLASLRRAWRPRGATPLRAFSSSLELDMAQQGPEDPRGSIDLAPEEAAGLAQFTLEKGPEWVYEEISKLRNWAERRRKPSPPEDD